MRRNIIAGCVLGTLFLAVALAVMTTPQEAEAVPAFARKYRMSCTTCHAPAPRLKDYGDEFAGNGFILKDQEAPRYFVETGDEDLDLIRDFPIAIRLDGFIKHQTNTDKEVDLSSPYNLKLISGGSLGKNLAYYFYFYFSEHGEIAGIEDAFLMFNDLFGHDLDVYLGQFAVCDPLFKPELRLTYEGYPIYKDGIGQSGINLSYDKGILVTYAAPFGTDFVVEVVNGNGIGEADNNRVFDKDKYKNIVGRVSHGITDFLRVGAFGYYGKERSTWMQTEEVENPVERSATNEVWMAGPDATISMKDVVEVNFQYLERRDDNPFFALTKPKDKIETRGGLTELILMPEGDRSKVYAVGLYNWREAEYDIDDYETITGHVGYLLRTNIRLIAENTYDIVNEENRFVLGFIAAF